MSGTMKFTDSPEQAAVVQAPSYADVVVVAGAGSGKTYTMTRRIITLIEQGVSPEKILGLTFTRQLCSMRLRNSSVSLPCSSHSLDVFSPESSNARRFLPIHRAPIWTACRL